MKEFWNQLGQIEFWLKLFETFQQIGPLPAILLAYVEALVPMLPLVAIVTFNVAGHGMFLGYFYSWLGSVLGAITVFSFFRYLRDKPLLLKLLKIKRVDRLMEWVSHQDRRLLFLLSIFPFTPSCLINISFGLSAFDRFTFMKTIVLAKSVMIASLVLFGTTVVNSFEEPLFILLALAILAVLYVLSNYMHQKSGLKDAEK